MEWISTKDRLPKDNTQVLITQYEYFDKSKPRYYDVALFLDGGWIDPLVEEDDDIEIHEPSHWMPLPLPPTELLRSDK